MVFIAKESDPAGSKVCPYNGHLELLFKNNSLHINFLNTKK